MAGLKLLTFGGLLPRLPDSLLPEGAAIVADNCDLAYGELRNMRSGSPIGAMRNVPRAIYTDDGLTFYTWPFDVNAVRSPVANDPYQRLYYTGEPGGMRVTSRISTRLDGGPPGTTYLVGVPRPTVAPKLSVKLPTVDSTTASFTIAFHYEYAGVRYQEGAASPELISSGEGVTKWRFSPPKKLSTTEASNKDAFPLTGEAGVLYLAKDTGKVYRWVNAAYAEDSDSAETPTAAFPVLRVTATSRADGSQIFDLYTDNSSFAGDGGIYSLTMAKDTGADTYTATMSVAIKESDKVTRAVVYTFVNTYDEEGPPSPPASVNTSPVVTVNVTVTKDAVGGYAPIKEIRIYGTADGSDLAQYFYRGRISVLSAGDGEQTFYDNTDPAAQDNPLSSNDYYPPDPALTGLMELPNGILCAWKGNELHFCEAYRPWAWPPAYVRPLHATIVGGIAHGTGAVITTVKWPYLLSGVSPDAMTEQRLNTPQAGVSKWSIVAVDDAVLYASNDGIVTVRGGVASLTQGQRFFTREVWRAMFPTGMSTLCFACWDGRLIAFSYTGVIKPFMIRFDEAAGAMSMLPSLTAQCAFMSVLDDQLYYADGATLNRFGAGAALSADWKSREVFMPRPLNFGFAQARVQGDWTLDLIADGEVMWTEALTTGVKDFALPGGYLSDHWMVRVRGEGRFRELRIAETAEELAQL